MVFSLVFTIEKSVALWSANIRKLAKDHKGYGSTAMFFFAFFTLSPKLNGKKYLDLKFAKYEKSDAGVFEKEFWVKLMKNY